MFAIRSVLVVPPYLNHNLYISMSSKRRGLFRIAALAGIARLMDAWGIDLGSSSPAVSDDFEKAILRARQGNLNFQSGDPVLMKEVFSHSSDVVIMGAWGGYERGWDQVEPRLDWAAKRFRGSRNQSFERLAAGNNGDFGYETFLEKADVRLADADGYNPMVLRVTHLYRRQSGEWKLIQRHADFLRPKG